MLIALLWYNEIINGKRTFKEVPASLKEKVKELLVKNKKEDLVVE